MYGWLSASSCWIFCVLPCNGPLVVWWPTAPNNNWLLLELHLRMMQHVISLHLTWNAQRRTCIQVVKTQQLPTPSYSAMSLQNWQRLLGRWRNIFRKTNWETSCLCFKPVAVLSLTLLWRALSRYFVENHKPQTFLAVANYQHPGPWSPFLLLPSSVNHYHLIRSIVILLLVDGAWS